jgi:hypothetical protein
MNHFQKRIDEIDLQHEKNDAHRTWAPRRRIAIAFREELLIRCPSIRIRFRVTFMTIMVNKRLRYGERL